MITLQQIFESPQTAKLGLVLLHSLWQITLVAIVVKLTLGWFSDQGGKKSSIRYSVAYVGLVSVCLAAAVTWLTIETPAPITVAYETSPPNAGQQTMGAYANESAIFANETQVAADLGTASSATLSTKPEALVLSQTPTVPASSLLGSWIVCGWLVGMALFAIRPIIGLRSASRLKKHGQQAVPDWVGQAVRRLKGSLGISKSVSVFQSALVAVPTVVGFIRPTILLPVSCMTNLTADELDSILLHELAHIRRHDQLTNLLQTFIETVFFFHPLVWWISRVVRNERENCCDDLAVKASGNSKSLVSALLSLEQCREGANKNLIGIMASNGGSLVNRVKRLIEPEINPRSLSQSVASISVLAVVVISSLASSALFANPESLSEQDELNTPPNQSLQQANSRIQDNDVLAPPINETKGVRLRVQPDKRTIVLIGDPDDVKTVKDLIAKLNLQDEPQAKDGGNLKQEEPVTTSVNISVDGKEICITIEGDSRSIGRIAKLIQGIADKNVPNPASNAGVKAFSFEDKKFAAAVEKTKLLKNAEAPTKHGLSGNFTFSIDPETKTIMVVSTPKNLERIEKLLRDADQPVYENIPLSDLPASSIIDQVNKILAEENSDKGAIDEQVKVIADPRTNSIVLSGSESDVAKVRKLIEKLSNESRNSKDSSQAVQTLQSDVKIESRDGRIIVTSRDSLKDAEAVELMMQRYLETSPEAVSKFLSVSKEIVSELHSIKTHMAKLKESLGANHPDVQALEKRAEALSQKRLAVEQKLQQMVRSSELLEEIRVQKNALESLKRQFGEEHPSVKTIEAAISELQKERAKMAGTREPKPQAAANKQQSSDRVDDLLNNVATERLLDLKTQLEESKTKYGMQHPIVSDLKLQIEVLEQLQTELQPSQQSESSDERAPSQDNTVEVRKRMMELKVQKAKLLEHYAASHPSVLQLERQIQFWKENLEMAADQQPSKDSATDKVLPTETEPMDLAQLNARLAEAKQELGDDHPLVTGITKQIERYEWYFPEGRKPDTNSDLNQEQKQEALSENQKKIAELKMAYITLTEAYGPKHPDVLSIKRQIELWEQLENQEKLQQKLFDQEFKRRWENSVDSPKKNNRR